MVFSLEAIFAGAFDPIKLLLTLAIVVAATKGRWVTLGISAVVLLAYLALANALVSVTDEQFVAHLVSMIVLVGIWTVVTYKWGWLVASIFGATVISLSAGVVYFSVVQSYDSAVAQLSDAKPKAAEIVHPTDMEIAQRIYERIQSGVATKYLERRISPLRGEEIDPLTIQMYMYTAVGRMDRLLREEVEAVRMEYAPKDESEVNAVQEINASTRASDLANVYPIMRGPLEVNDETVRIQYSVWRDAEMPLGVSSSMNFVAAPMMAYRRAFLFGGNLAFDLTYEIYRKSSSAPSDGNWNNESIADWINQNRDRIGPLEYQRYYGTINLREARLQLLDADARKYAIKVDAAFQEVGSSSFYFLLVMLGCIVALVSFIRRKPA